LDIVSAEGYAIELLTTNPEFYAELTKHCTKDSEFLLAETDIPQEGLQDKTGLFDNESNVPVSTIIREKWTTRQKSG
jgi:hypothetical protein